MNETGSKSLRFLKEGMIALFVFFALITGFVFWYKYTARPTETFCNTVAVDTGFDDVYARARKMQFDVEEKSDPRTDEKVFIVSKQPNGESQCAIYVKDNKVIKKHYVLHL